MKLKYSVDNHNRLLIRSTKSKTPLIPKGSFSINKDSQLEYWLNEPLSWRRLYNLPSRIVFEGNWSLNVNHDLELRLSKTREHLEDSRIVLKGGIVSIDNNVLSFEIVTAQGEFTGVSQFRILKLAGIWQADERNRITFRVNKKQFPDTLTFKAGWQINKNQQIEYTYEKTSLITKSKIDKTIVFDGFWKIDSRHRLIYILSCSFDSSFVFKAQIENPNVYPQGKSIKYRLGIGISKSKKLDYKVITLYGEWKFKRNLGLIFKMDYGDNNVQELEFGAEVSFEHKRLVFSIKDTRGKPLGITLTYSYSLFNSLEPQAFIRLKSYRKELGFEAGFSLPF